MKYGQIVFAYSDKLLQMCSKTLNLGDNLQSYVIEDMLKKCGIAEEEIISINYFNMKEYNGEYAIVPIFGTPFLNIDQNNFPISERIIPIFISFTISDSRDDTILPYLKKWEPIGCRDETTMLWLRSKGVDAYLSGCITLTMKKREQIPEKGKIFLADISKKLEPYIPEEILCKAERITHKLKIDVSLETIDEYKKYNEEARRLYDKYRKEANLVITSRLHAAIPCIAMGIPVILAIDNIDSRFSWLDKIIPIYDLDHYKDINWHPKTVDIEPIKYQIMNNFMDQIEHIRNTKERMLEMSYFWENREKVNYNGVLKGKIDRLLYAEKNGCEFRYIIWGAGVHGKVAHRLVSEYYPNSKLVAIVDRYISGTLFNVNIIKPQEVKSLEFDYAFITSYPARHEAVEALSMMHKEKNKQWCYFISKDVPEEE